MSVGRSLSIRQDQQNSNDIFLLKASFHRLSKRLIFLENFIKSKFRVELNGNVTRPKSPLISSYRRVDVRIKNAYQKKKKSSSRTSSDLSTEEQPEVELEEEVFLRDSSGQPIHWEDTETLEQSHNDSETEPTTLQTIHQDTSTNIDSKDELKEGEGYLESQKKAIHFEIFQKDDSDADYSPKAEDSEDTSEEDASSSPEFDINLENIETTTTFDEIAVKWLHGLPTPTKNQDKNVCAVGKTHRPPLKCPVCDKEFPGMLSKARKNLKAHQDIHSTERKYKCRFCPKTYRQDRPLRTHIQRVHQKDKYSIHQCQFCERKFVSPQEHSKHEMTHTGEKPEICHICGAAFVQKPNLKRHLLTHSEVKNCLCQECGKSFRNVNALNKHIDSVHLRVMGPDGKRLKSVNCPFCDVLFVNEHSMKKHKKKFHPISGTPSTSGSKSQPHQQTSKGEGDQLLQTKEVEMEEDQ